jgi:hypothetical protein
MKQVGTKGAHQGIQPTDVGDSLRITTLIQGKREKGTTPGGIDSIGNHQGLMTAPKKLRGEVASHSFSTG